jgi:tetratricopeptide (TPR) repeat protein
VGVEMNLDFTFTKYMELCEAMINSDYVLLAVEKYLTLNNKPVKYIILRHDVDIKPERSLIIAQIEREFDIGSTYYFRMTDEVYQPALIKQIAELGHEIGYHYEVLDKAKGDYEKAIEIFEKELNELRKIHDIKTICMHGNSRTRWDNRDLWKHYDFKEFGIIGEAYLSVDFNDVVYFSDTARTWNPRYKIKDSNGSSEKRPIINKTDDLTKLIMDEKLPHLYISLHPDDWCDDFGKWLSNFVTRKFKNVGKYCIGWYWKTIKQDKKQKGGFINERR